MIRHGQAPFLECSSLGDRRFSAMYAYVTAKTNSGGLAHGAIERHYQAAKIFPDGSSGLLPHQAKGRRAINQIACADFYSQLWDEYIRLNPDLLAVLQNVTGLSDTFGQPGHCCQATELWRIRNQSLGLPA